MNVIVCSLTPRRRKLVMYSINFCFDVSAGIDNVFQAISTASGLSRWWTPDVTIVPEVGSCAFINFGNRYQNTMHITECKSPRSFGWICVEGHEEWINTRFSFLLKALSQKETEVRFCQSNWKENSDFLARCSFHWGHYMISLKSYCETGVGSPFVE